MKKKTVIILIIFAFVFVFSACGEKNNNNEKNTNEIITLTMDNYYRYLFISKILDTKGGATYIEISGVKESFIYHDVDIEWSVGSYGSGSAKLTLSGQALIADTNYVFVSNFKITNISGTVELKYD